MCLLVVREFIADTQASFAFLSCNRNLVSFLLKLAGFHLPKIDDYLDVIKVISNPPLCDLNVHNARMW